MLQYERISELVDYSIKTKLNKNFFNKNTKIVYCFLEFFTGGNGVRSADSKPAEGLKEQLSLAYRLRKIMYYIAS